jgi:hypothetical protein
MPRAGYHALAAVHHEAKAGVYARAGFGAKADGHRRRAAWHASFGDGYADDDIVGGFAMRTHRLYPNQVHDPVESPLEYGGHLSGEERDWDPHTADPNSDKYDPDSAYSRMLEEVRASGAFAPSGRAGSRAHPSDLDPEDPEDASAVQARQRAGYAARTERAQDGYAARAKLKELTRDMYDRRMRGEDADYSRLYRGSKNPGSIRHAIMDDAGDYWIDTENLAHVIEIKAKRDERARAERRLRK